MYQTGALIVESSKLLLPALAAASRIVSGVLYIPLEYENQRAEDARHIYPEERAHLLAASQQIKNIYNEASKFCPLLDVRILLPSLSPHGRPEGSTLLLPHLQYENLDVILSSMPTWKGVESSPGYRLLAKRVKVDLERRFKKIEVDESTRPDFPLDEVAEAITYNHIVLGGTFDNIHNGHRLLMTQSALIAQRRILIGISSGPLLEAKILPELIKPVTNRIADVKCFLCDIKPWIKHEVVPITDVYGPTTIDRELQCVVVSPETVRGADMINSERKRKGLNPLAVHTIDIVDRLSSDSVETPSLAQEAKLSSSDIRRNMLGTYRPLEVCSTPLSNRPYLIGLTGGIASGKSTLSKKLTDKGVYPVDCDKLGHKAYIPGTPAHLKIIETFGKGIVTETGEIDRRKLGPIVFSNKDKLEQLNRIVWPEIWNMVQREVEKAGSLGFTVCVIDAAVLLRAGWNKNMHEVWITIAPTRNVIKRIMERDNSTEEAAQLRMNAQPSNAEYVQQANVIFSTQWDPEYTQKQVDKSWKELQERIGATQNTTVSQPSSQL